MHGKNPTTWSACVCKTHHHVKARMSVFSRRLCPTLWRECRARSHSKKASSVKSVTSKKADQLLSRSVRVCGWIKSARKQKQLVFIDVNDGSALKSLQVVASLDQLPHARELTLGCSVEVTGTLQESSHSQQAVELHADDITVLGQCNPQEYPFKARKAHSAEYVRQFPHLRARTKSFSSLLRIRDTATSAIHQYFRGCGFINVHTPILTSSDCEGAGDLFLVKPSRDGGNEDKEKDFFGSKAYLTVSGQLHAEAIACGMSSVYTFGPTFRAESSHTRRHLSEFYMIEAETVTVGGGLQTLLDLVHGLFTHTVDVLLTENEEDMSLYHDRSPHTKDWLVHSLSKPFSSVSYTEAVEILSRAHSHSPFKFEPRWGCDLQTEHEQYLVAHIGQRPLFVTDFPASQKAFYARENEDQQTVSAVDLLMPGIGEVVGGSLREERLGVLADKLTRLGMMEQYQWYVDLRRFGSIPHGGFGLGFERLLQALLGVEHIRDVTPFPRFLGSCEM